MWNNESTILKVSARKNKYNIFNILYSTQHVPSGKPGVHQAVPAALLDERGCPLDDLALDPAGQLLDGSAGGGGLEEEDAEAVDVAALGDLPPHCVLRREVAERALDAGGEVRDAVGDELREAKVGDLRGKVGVQEHVAGLDVPVDDMRAHLVVQIPEFIYIYIW